MQPTQPKITQQLMLRTAIGIFVLAAFVLAFQWYKSRESDPNGAATINSSGWIAALESDGDTNHAVIFKDDGNGTVIHQPGEAKTVNDRDIAWRPDGNFLFFASDRLKGKYTMFRWYPDAGSAPEMRSLEGLPQGAPYFQRSDADKHENAIGLITGGGRVLSYDPKTPALRQMLPPPDPKQRAAMDPSGGGGSSPFEIMYERFGTSFRTAKWSPDRKGIYAVMRREDGELLIYQKMDFTNPQEGQPRAIVQGDRIDFDVDQNSGVVYFTVEDFQWPLSDVPPEYVKNGKITVPYKHGLGVLDQSQANPIQMIQVSKDDKTCFASPVLSPQGDKLAFTVGPYTGDGTMTPKMLVTATVAGQSRGQITPLCRGEIYEPSWSPDDNSIAFAERDGKTSRPIYVITSGSPPRRVSSADGVYSYPLFSPQMPKGQ